MGWGRRAIVAAVAVAGASVASGTIVFTVVMARGGDKTPPTGWERVASGSADGVVWTLDARTAENDRVCHRLQLDPVPHVAGYDEAFLPTIGCVQNPGDDVLFHDPLAVVHFAQGPNDLTYNVLGGRVAPGVTGGAVTFRDGTERPLPLHGRDFVLIYPVAQRVRAVVVRTRNRKNPRFVCPVETGTPAGVDDFGSCRPQ